MWLSVAEAAEKLGCSEAEVRARVSAGLLQAEQVDGELRVATLSVLEEVGRSLSAQMGAAQSRRGSVLVAILVPVSLMMLLIFTLVYLMLLADGQGFIPVPPLVYLALLWGSLAGLAALARWDGDLQAVNGLGVTLYGRRQTERGVVGTAWLVVLLVPVAPVRSYLVRSEQKLDSSPMSRRTVYQLEPLEALYWPVVAPTLAAVWTALGVAAAIMVWS
jgi:hypothetical protein